MTWCRGYVEWRNMPTPDQMREARMLISALRPRKLNIDKGGMGVTIYEMLNREFPGIVEGVQFTPQSKEAMAVLGNLRMEEMKVRLPAAQQPVYHFKDVALLVGKPICSPSGLDRALGIDREARNGFGTSAGKPIFAGIMKKVL